MKYDCLINVYNLLHNKNGTLVKGGLYTNCFVECEPNEFNKHNMDEIYHKAKE